MTEGTKEVFCFIFYLSYARFTVINVTFGQSLKSAGSVIKFFVRHHRINVSLTLKF